MYMQFTCMYSTHWKVHFCCFFRSKIYSCEIPGYFSCGGQYLQWLPQVCWLKCRTSYPDKSQSITDSRSPVISLQRGKSLWFCPFYWLCIVFPLSLSHSLTGGILPYFKYLFDDGVFLTCWSYLIIYIPPACVTYMCGKNCFLWDSSYLHDIYMCRIC